MDLNRKFELYKALILTKQDKDGFIMSDKCDSLLFSGLVGCIPGIKVNIDAARDGHGAWHRRPIDLEPCCKLESYSVIERLKEALKTRSTDPKVWQKIFERGSSTISRDMLMGLAWYTWHNKRLDIAEGVISYAMSQGLRMGIGSPTRTLMTPGLLSTFAWIAYRLGAKRYTWLRFLPHLESKKVTGFQAHLSVLHILLRNEVTGTKANQDVLDYHYARQSQNPLYAYAAGDILWAKVQLLNDKYWPNNELPTEADRSSDWITQRDYGPDWMPANVDPRHCEVFTGGDFLFTAWLVLSRT